MPSRYQGTETEVRALSALINLARAGDALASQLQRTLAGKDLTSSQFGILEALFHIGPLCQGELAAKQLRCCGSITSVVGGLERRGLVLRKREAEDKRFVRVELTEKGRKLIAGVFPGHAREVTKRFSVLSPKEQEELRRLCRKLGRSMAGA
jgi:MarR family 2-MHQ and catechol resistance regulon transcriptional repressor